MPHPISGKKFKREVGYTHARCCGNCEYFLFKSAKLGSIEGKCRIVSGSVFQPDICRRFEWIPFLRREGS